MGLAPYGDPESERTQRWKQAILDELVDLRPDGSLLLNQHHFGYATGLRMCNEARWQAIFGIPPRSPESELTQEYMDLALAAQWVTEEAVFRMADTAHELTGCQNLVMAGGVALNCVANGKLLRRGPFKAIWIQPAAGDAGGAVGGALAAWHIWGQQARTVTGGDGMRGGYLGPWFHEIDCKRVARKHAAPYVRYENEQALVEQTAGYIDEGKVVGWFQGRMEYGPRALGNRSILADARQPDMQKKLNLKIKYREGFRPFAPSVLEEDVGEYFAIDRPSPYMLLVADVVEPRRKPVAARQESEGLFERLYHPRSDIPAVTHVDYSARIQSVSQETNPRFWRLLRAFKERTGYGVLVNTSFNVRGEPIVCTPADAYRCFMRTEMDVLVLGNLLFLKEEQPTFHEDADWHSTFTLD